LTFHADVCVSPRWMMRMQSSVPKPLVYGCGRNIRARPQPEIDADEPPSAQAHAEIL
jgi:hypothetical protein